MKFYKLGDNADHKQRLTFLKKTMFAIVAPDTFLVQVSKLDYSGGSKHRLAEKLPSFRELGRDKQNAVAYWMSKKNSEKVYPAINY